MTGSQFADELTEVLGPFISFTLKLDSQRVVPREPKLMSQVTALPMSVSLAYSLPFILSLLIFFLAIAFSIEILKVTQSVKATLSPRMLSHFRNLQQHRHHEIIVITISALVLIADRASHAVITPGYN